MSHLSLETIARLVENAPAVDEAAHLKSCDECRGQLAAMTEDVHALAMLPDMAAAPDQWHALERRLGDEGLIRIPSRRVGRGLRMMQIAAALTLFVGGTVAGRLTAGQDAPATASAPSTPAAATRGSFAASSQPASMNDAAQLLRETEELYLEALTRYAELATRAEPGDPVARLAGLQSIVLTTQAALTEAPTDPVINGYHLTALAQRDVTLRQVAAASSERWY